LPPHQPERPLRIVEHLVVGDCASLGVEVEQRSRRHVANGITAAPVAGAVGAGTALLAVKQAMFCHDGRNLAAQLMGAR
jgi:hypothetical protein